MINLCRNNLLSAFSLALDLAENKLMGHAKRTAYLALMLGRKMNLSEEELSDIYAASFLHDIGVTNARKHYQEDLELLVAHPRLGSDIIEKLPFGPNVSEYVKLHHINWDGSNVHLFDEELTNGPPNGAQIIYLADQVDIRFDKGKCMYAQRQLMLEWLKNCSGVQFNPKMVEAFIELTNNEKFWLDYNFFDMDVVLKNIQPKNPVMVNLAQLENIAEAFAMIIDNKSKFTSHHSQAVADLIEIITKAYGYDLETVKKAKIAGLLHDLGKLAVPSEIVNKPGKLDENEFCIVKSHTYYTKAILGMVEGFEDIKEWAANHHETIDGRGYPEGIKGEQLSLIERLMSVSDIYQALTEQRPYRESMSQSQAFSIMQEMVQNQKICPEGFDILKRTVT